MLSGCESLFVAIIPPFHMSPEVMALENFLKTNGFWTLLPTLSPDGRHTSRRLNPLNCSSSYLLRLEESTKCISWIFTFTSKMTPKWQKSLSAMEIDYSDCCEPHSSWGDCGDRCCFSRMKISLMLVNRCWIQKPRSENESNIHQRQCRLRWRCPYRRKWLFLSHKCSFLLAFSSISHLLTLLLITVKDSAQPAAAIKTWFLWTQTDFSLSAAGECERVEECRFQVVKP